MEIKFNVGSAYQTGASQMNLMRLDEIKIDPTNTDKTKLPWVQMFCSGNRETKDNLDWSKWNGCIYSDLDSKHYYNECKPFKADNLFKMLCENLRYNYFDNFYAIQFSNSRTGFHIIFYFNVEKTEENFKKCNQFTQNAVRDSFYNIGAKEIYDYKGVADKCSLSPYQGMFVTTHPWEFSVNNTESFGSFLNIDDYEIEEEQIYRTPDIKEDGTKLFVFDGYKNNDFKIHCDNFCRWRIYTSLIGVFTDKEKVDYEWEHSIVPHLIKTHTNSDYINAPTKGKWWEQYDPKYVDVSLLEKFGYNFKKVFEPQIINLYEPDVIYELKENERLSDINIKWSETKINHLYAGCSLGKTYNAKVLGEQNDISDIDFAFGARNKRVCFISPMRSINKDSFTNIDGWEIIDSDHNEENINKYGSIENLLNSQTNICTTWDSFISRKMYNINFDFVIVDEIHTFYMYDYRIKTICEMKEMLPKANGIKIIMTGTPSMEVNEFDCYKIQVNKKLNEVKCDIVFYNNSFRGYYMNDIKEWSKDKNHYVIIFSDTANYKWEETLSCYNLKGSIFNSNYKNNVNYVLDNHNVSSQITIFSVYGQAGINLYIDTDKKLRIYILNKNGLGIIQYSNRVRNREVIDKIILGYKYNEVSNNVTALSTDVDFVDANKRVDMLNSIQKPFNIFEIKNKNIIKLKFKLNEDYLDKIDNKYFLNNDLYKTYKLIENVNKFETQIQVIYNRLISNSFNVNFVYLDKDTKDIKKTKMRSNTFAGKMVNFDYNMIKKSKNGTYWVEPSEDFRKICTGNLLDTLDYIWSELSLNCDFDEVKDKFNQFIVNTIDV